LRNVAFIIFLCLNSWLFSSTLTIKQDGTGDFTTIQAGIDASVDGDTVLVHPGIYYENLSIIEKNITLASLEFTTGDPQYIASTVIDGQRQESGIVMRFIDDFVTVQGFTIQNCYSTFFDSPDGGGIQVIQVNNGLIKNCQIQDNIALKGGGIYAVVSTLTLSGLNIVKNSASLGGGMCIMGVCSISFDPDNLCNIYNNNAGKGADLQVRNDAAVHVVVDTFSVLTPDSYFVDCYDDATATFDIQHGRMELVDHDLYVAPDGDDSNSGLSADDPLKNISWAVRQIDPSSDNPLTIHVAAGTYSWQDNQQIYPIGFKPYLSIIGEEMETTILKNDYIDSSIYGWFIDGPIEFSNFTLINEFDLTSSYVGLFCTISSLTLTNLNFVGCDDIKWPFTTEHVNATFDNVTLSDFYALAEPGFTLYTTSGSMKNCASINNGVIPNPLYIYSITGLSLNASDEFTVDNTQIYGCYSTNNESIAMCMAGNVMITNSLICGNVTNSDRVLSAHTEENEGISFINTTITDNCNSEVTLLSYGNISMRNTIMHNNAPYEIIMKNDFPYDNILDVDYCNIKNGQNGIINEDNANIIIWGEHNIEDDPGFMLTGELPYQLAAGSPCIDAGTPDTTGLFLPPWDLLQNHRVWDGTGNGQARVDMGCYEYGAGPWVYAQPPVVPAGEYVVCNYPNPFKPSAGRGPATVISFSVPDAGEVELVIYNMRGQKVRTLMQCYSAPGSYKAQWDGRDGNNQPVASGVYFAQLITPQRTTAHKMMLLK
jgi:hypothetical protein